MALGTSEITTTLVATTIGEVTNDVGALCRSSKVNRWSRFRPGYWRIIEGVVSFIAPNSLLTDERFGIPFSYYLGDFRSYNNNAQPLQLQSISPVIVSIPEGTSAIQRGYLFNTGEIDWLGSEIQRNAKNFINPCTHYHLIDLATGDRMYSKPIPVGVNLVVEFIIDLPVQEIIKSYQLGIGNSTMIYGLFSDIIVDYNIHIQLLPLLNTNGTPSLHSVLYNAIGENIFMVETSLNNLSIPYNSNSYDATMSMTAYGDMNNYRIYGGSGNMTVDIKYYKNNILTNTDSDISISYGSGANDFYFTIPFTHSLVFDEKVYIEIKDISNFNYQLIS